ncbi:YceI family protein [Candidatus Marinimicrobia bacterium PRS2]|nr:YceI family protein [Candidatus Marinimicrobia bacterium PRS2]
MSYSIPEGKIIINSILFKGIIICSALATLITASDTLYINVDSSVIKWTGRKVTGEHSGTLNLSDGFVIWNGKSIAGGKITFDMTSIHNTDIESREWKEKLEKHLMAEDFFFVDSFPNAILEIKYHHQIVDDKTGQTNQIIADLTIRGITHEINFPINIYHTKSNFYAEGSIDIDRTLFNINYKSGTLFDNLGDRMIYDNFTIQFSLQTKAKYHK